MGLNPPAEFTGLKELSAYFDVPYNTVKIWKNYGLPWDGGAKLIDVCRWLASKKWVGEVSKSLAKYQQPDEPTSDQLERKRRIEADIKQIELDERRRVSIPSNELVPLLNGLGLVLRTAGENLEKHCGMEAAEILNEAIEQFEKQVKQAFEREDT